MPSLIRCRFYCPAALIYATLSREFDAVKGINVDGQVKIIDNTKKIMTVFIESPMKSRMYAFHFAQVGIPNILFSDYKTFINEPISS